VSIRLLLHAYGAWNQTLMFFFYIDDMLIARIE